MTIDYKLGHRERLRQRFLADEGKSMPDYELLEMLLSIAIPRRDVKPLAKELLKKFGSFANVINAKKEDLIKIDGIKETTATILILIKTSANRMSWQSLYSAEDSLVTNWDGLVDYCRGSMCYQKVEEFRIIFFNPSGKIIAEETHQKGTVDAVAVYVREIVSSVVKHSAKAIVLVHNHPSGIVEPSKNDIAITKQICEAMKSIDVTVWDHLIVSKNDVYSFKQYGLLGLLKS